MDGRKVDVSLDGRKDLWYIQMYVNVYYLDDVGLCIDSLESIFFETLVVSLVIFISDWLDGQ